MLLADDVSIRKQLMKTHTHLIIGGINNILGFVWIIELGVYLACIKIPFTISCSLYCCIVIYSTCLYSHPMKQNRMFFIITWKAFASYRVRFAKQQGANDFPKHTRK